jgi:hypothetical protein
MIINPLLLCGCLAWLMAPMFDELSPESNSCCRIFDGGSGNSRCD